MSEKYRNSKINNFTDLPYLVQNFLNYDGAIKNRAVNTIQSYAYDLKNFLQYILYLRNPDDYCDGMKSIDISYLDEEFFASVEQEEILEYLYYLKHTRNISATTRSRYLTSIKVFFNYLHAHKKVIYRDPAANIDAPKKSKKLPVYLTVDEAICLLNHLDVNSKSYERDYCILILFLNCGLRLSELVNMNIYDIRNDDTLRVTGKGDKQRMIYLNNACKKAIMDYNKVRMNTDKPIVDKDAFFISRKTGKRLGRRRVQQVVTESLKNANLNGMGFSTHKLRHTAATLMYQNGVDVRTLKDVLGHEQLSTTQIYTHLNKEQLQSAMECNPLSECMSKK